jgi:hypothetical protein
MLGLKKLVFISCYDCRLFDNWFYFNGIQANLLTVKTMLKCHSKAQQKLFERRKSETLFLDDFNFFPSRYSLNCSIDFNFSVVKGGPRSSLVHVYFQLFRPCCWSRRQGSSINKVNILRNFHSVECKLIFNFSFMQAYA